VHRGKILLLTKDIVQPAHRIGLISLFANWNHMMVGDRDKLIKYYDRSDSPKTDALSLCFI
jgi:hypothetical protein